MKKISALLLVLAMVCACAVCASAAQTTLPDADCPGWWQVFSDGIAVTEEGVEITFTNTSYADASQYYHGPAWIMYTGDEAKVNGAGYFEYWVQRGDNFGWAVGANYGVDGTVDSAEANAANLAAAGITYVSSVGHDWENYVANAKAGIEVRITSVREGNTVITTTEVGDVVSVVTLPVTADKPVYISLTGEMTKLTNIKVSEGISAQALEDINCTGFWKAFTEGVEIDTVGVEITFTNTTYADASGNHNGPIWVLYNAALNRVNGTGYTEYWVQRGDNYGWAGAVNTGTPDALAAAGITYEGVLDDSWGSWETFQAALKAGAEGKLTAVREGDKVTVTTEIAGVISTVSIPVAAGQPAYLSLSGELTRLTNIKVKSLAAEPVPGAPTTPTPDPDGPAGTGDTALALPIALMAVSAAAIMILKKKGE